VRDLYTAMTDLVLVLSSPPGGEIAPGGAYKDSFPVSDINGLYPVDNLVVYASPSGNDTNSGLTPEAPVQSLRRALTIVTNTGWNLSAVVSLGPGDYPVTGPILNIIQARGGTQSGTLEIAGSTLTTAFPRLVVGSVTGGSTVPFVLNCGVSLSAYVGAQATFTSGALSGQAFILGNPVGNTFSIMTTGTGPAPGDTLSILVPTARLVQGAGELEFLTTVPVYLSDLDIVVAAATSPAGALVFGQSQFMMSGVRMYPAAGALQAAVAILGASLLTGGTAPGLPSPIGCAIYGTSPTSVLSIIALSAMLDSLSNTYFQHMQLSSQDGNLSSADSQFVGCILNLNRGSSVAWNQCQILGAPSTGVSLSLSQVDFTQLDVSLSGSDGILVESSSVELTAPTSVAGLNAGYGLHLANQSRADMQGSSGVSSISGTSGPVKIGSNPAVTWAQISANSVSRSDGSTAPGSSAQFASLAR
jgi:hypothetical protein